VTLLVRVRDNRILADAYDKNTGARPIVTETHATIFPPDRYGRRRQPRRARRWLPYVMAVALGLGVTGIAVKLYLAYGVTDYAVNLTSYRDITDNQVVLQFTVTKPENSTAVCVVRARNRAGAEVGRAEVLVPEARSRVDVSYTLSTTGLPVSGETVGCRAQR
jgi:hypothetical protein